MDSGMTSVAPKQINESLVVLEENIKRLDEVVSMLSSILIPVTIEYASILSNEKEPAQPKVPMAMLIDKSSGQLNRIAIEIRAMIDNNQL